MFTPSVLDIRTVSMRNVVKGVMTRSIFNVLSELCSQFLKGGNSAFITAIMRSKVKLFCLQTENFTASHPDNRGNVW